jgi:1-acyl-sn-glycerol-3-phosphate acyltransferase
MLSIAAARSLIRLIALFGTAFQGAIEFVFMKARGRASVAERAEWLHRACSRALRRMNIPVERRGEIPASGLIAANHLSYLDILALSALAPFVFIAKKEVRKWPVFGWMAKTAGCVFVDRERKLDTGKVNEDVAAALRAGLRVVLFPEGTSSDGSGVLPFRPSLFEPAISAGAQIIPTYIGYAVSSGSVANNVAYWGEMTFFPHALKLFSIASISVNIQFGPTMSNLQDRKQAADATRNEVLRLAGISGEKSDSSKISA